MSRPPTPAQLLTNPGIIGQILRLLPPQAIERVARYQNPWERLGQWVRSNQVEQPDEDSADDRARIVARFLKTFKAAASQRNAMLRLVEIGRGGGTISKSWLSQIQNAPNCRVANHWADKVLASMLRMERGRKFWLRGELSPAIRAEARRRYKRFYAADVRRLGKKKADAKWKNPNDNFKLRTGTAGEKIGLLMTEWWLSGPAGFPGLCFMSDEATAKVLGLMLPFTRLYRTDAGWKIVRTIRERIGLKKGAILIKTVKQFPNGRWAVLGPQGETFGTFSAGTPLPPEL